MQDINKIKNKLSILFSIVAFLSVFILGLIFLSTKYINETRIAKNNFDIQVDFLTEPISNYSDRMQDIKNSGLKHGQGMKIGQGKLKDLYSHDKGINYLYIEANGEISASNITSDFPEKIILDAIKTNKYVDKAEIENGFLIRSIKYDIGHQYVFFKELDYPFENYLVDIISFLIFSLLFSFLIYFPGKIFINKIFFPVEENIKDMNDFVHNAGHELKTPISVIDSNIQLLFELETGDKAMLKEMKSEVKKLNSLIDSLVNLSELDGYVDNNNIILNEVLDDILSNFTQNFNKKSIKVSKNIPDNILLNVNKDYLYIFLSNIIGNAIKYNKKGGKIDISYEGGKLLIKDTGIGIREEDLSKIFDRFYKTDDSRNSEGFGIGLSLVKKIALIYSWKINIESDLGVGTSVSIKF